MEGEDRWWIMLAFVAALAVVCLLVYFTSLPSPPPAPAPSMHIGPPPAYPTDPDRGTVIVPR
jgi:hypothetical protein